MNNKFYILEDNDFNEEKFKYKKDLLKKVKELENRYNKKFEEGCNGNMYLNINGDDLYEYSLEKWDE
jgi:hypothetical protein